MIYTATGMRHRAYLSQLSAEDDLTFLNNAMPNVQPLRPYYIVPLFERASSSLGETPPISATVRDELDYLVSIGFHRESLEYVAGLLDRTEADIIGYNTKNSLAAFIAAAASRLKSLNAPKDGCLRPDPTDTERLDAQRWRAVVAEALSSGPTGHVIFYGAEADAFADRLIAASRSPLPSPEGS
jgi:hypothetical protein